MISQLQPYPEYKDSEQAWLGLIPRHWEIKPAFGGFRPIHDRNHRLMEKTVLSLSYGRIVIKPIEKLHGLVPESFETYQIVNPGDIILRTTDLQNDHTSLRVGIVRDRGIITSAYLALRAQYGVNPEFGFLLLSAWDTSKAIYGYGSGLRQSLDFSHFKRMPIAVPPAREQQSIVVFLKWANRRLDKAITAKRAEIALLREQKAVIIHNMVTRGLDTTSPMRATGVPWLGEIPNHWNVVPLKFLCSRIQNGATPATTEQQYYQNGTVPWFGPSSIIGSSSEVGKPIRFLTTKAFDNGKARLIKGPAILVIVIGATAGKMGLLINEGSTNQQITAFELNYVGLNPHFAIHQLRSSEEWLKSTASTATIPILDLGIVNRLEIAFPSLEEQKAILTLLLKQTQPLDTTISRLEREIELLREYRTRLVADVVTGKLNVQNAAANLPKAPHEKDDGGEPEFSLEAEPSCGETPYGI